MGGERRRKRSIMKMHYWKCTSMLKIKHTLVGQNEKMADCSSCFCLGTFCALPLFLVSAIFFQQLLCLNEWGSAVWFCASLDNLSWCINALLVVDLCWNDPAAFGQWKLIMVTFFRCHLLQIMLHTSCLQPFQWPQPSYKGHSHVRQVFMVTF